MFISYLFSSIWLKSSVLIMLPFMSGSVIRIADFYQIAFSSDDL